MEICTIWSTHPSKENLTNLLAKGSILVNEKKFNQAYDIFSRVIFLDPNWSEAWNKRATILYMMGRYKESQNDIDQVLKLEKRHFGALAGQGLVSIALENYEKAIQSYKEVEKIYPNLESPKIMIPKIKELIKSKSI
jgi:tetratricopeptide (TPR) repeat protein